MLGKCLLNNYVTGARALKHYRNFREDTVTFPVQILGGTLEPNSAVTFVPSYSKGILSKARGPSTWIQPPKGYHSNHLSLRLWHCDQMAFGNSCLSPFLLDPQTFVPRLRENLATLATSASQCTSP